MQEQVPLGWLRYPTLTSEPAVSRATWSKKGAHWSNNSATSFYSIFEVFMPKRVLDGDAMWASSKLESCKPEHIAEYSWLYPLADCNGSFEMTSLRVLCGKVYAIRRGFTEDDLRSCLVDFEKNGLLFVWSVRGKVYGHWTGSATTQPRCRTS